jgi:hypothetical protein
MAYLLGARPGWHGVLGAADRRGVENDPEVVWVLVQVPDFQTFDPIESGLLPAGTDRDSPEFFASYQQLIYDF